jgi:hypothetical protein
MEQLIQAAARALQRAKDSGETPVAIAEAQEIS